MSPAVRLHHNTTAQARTALKQHSCITCYPLRLTIKPGERYLELKEFPGGESGYADSAGHPVRAAECADCATRHGRGDLLKGGQA